MRRTADDDETIHRRSGWLLPLGVFAVTSLLSAAFLLFYLAPPGGLLGKEIDPTSRSDAVSLTVGGVPFRIPANYLIYAAARKGGEHREVILFALLPNLSGWSNWDTEAFSSNAPDSNVVYLTLRQDRAGLDESGKLHRVYLEYVQDRNGRPAPYGLTRYTFRDDTGYRREDLFVGAGSKPMVMRCVQQSREVPSPSCLREVLIAKNLILSYRFKRSHLAQWGEIAAKVDKLVNGFKPADLSGRPLAPV